MTKEVRCFEASRSSLIVEICTADGRAQTLLGPQDVRSKRHKDATGSDRTLLGAPGIATRSKTAHELSDSQTCFRCSGVIALDLLNVGSFKAN